MPDNGLSTGLAAAGALRGRSLLRSPLFWIGIVFTLGFGYLAVRDVHLAETWEALARSDYRWLAPATATFAVAMALRAVRWRALFHEESRPPLGAALRALLVGYFFNNLLPLRAGEAARVIALKRFCATSRVEAASTVVIERVYDVASLFALLFLALAWLPDLAWTTTATALAAAFAAVLLATIVVLTRRPETVSALGLRVAGLVPLLGRERAEHAVANMMRGVAGLTRSRTALVALAWTVVSWLVLAVSFWLVMKCFGLGLPLMAGILVVIATSLSLALPSSPGALGVFEAAVVLSLAAYGVPPAEALSYALVLHAMNFFAFLIAGVFALRPEILSPWRAAGRISRA